MSETIEIGGRTFKITCIYDDDGCSVSETTYGNKKALCYGVSYEWAHDCIERAMREQKNTSCHWRQK